MKGEESHKVATREPGQAVLTHCLKGNEGTGQKERKTNRKKGTAVRKEAGARANWEPEIPYQTKE